jgi:hypothetical protein
MGDRKGAYRALVQKSNGKRPLVIPRHRWEDNIKSESSESGMGRHCSDLGEEQVAASSGWRNKPSGSIKFRQFVDNVRNC